MGIDSAKTPVLFSTGTYLAYKIAHKYYNNTHFVWCTTKFNSIAQPPTSNPQTICKRYLEQINTEDRHAQEIEKNISGILTGAKYKLDQGLITNKQYREIKSIVSVAEYESFLPVIYIIYSDKVKSKCIEVNKYDCASDTSVEYKVELLEEGDFSVIILKDVLHDILESKVRKAGE